MTIDKQAVKKILLITLSNIGDVVLTLPVLEVLKREFPEAEITVMVSAPARELFEADSSLYRIIIYDKHTPLSKKVRLALDMRRFRFDMVVDLRNSLFPLLIGARYNTPLFGPKADPHIHRKDKHLKKLSSMGISTEGAVFKINFNRDDRLHIHTLLNERGMLPDDKMIAVAAGAKSHIKRWGEDKFITVCDRLNKELGFRMLLMGDDSDSPINDEIASSGLKDIYNLSGKTNLRELTYLLSLCKILITNDSAPLHIASAIGLPTVAIFGPTDYRRYGPLAPHSRVIRKSLNCAPCEEALCRFDLECMKQVSADEVFDAVKEILEKKGTGYFFSDNQLYVKKVACPPFFCPPFFKKILLIRTDRLGDVVLTTPAIKAIRSAYPDAHIAVMVRPYTELVVRGNPYLDEVIVYDKYGRHKSTIASIRFAMELKKKKFDLAVIFHPTNRTHITAYLAHIPKRIGYDECFAFLLTDRIKNTKHEGRRHELDYNLEMLRVIGIETKERELYVPVEQEAVTFVNNLLAQSGIEEHDKIITLHPGASCPSKIWPSDRFAKLADMLIQNSGVKIVVVGGEDEKGISCVQEVKKFMQNKVLFLAGRLNVSQLSALLKRSILFVSNDSGPVHIAVAVKTPVVALFGRNQPGLNPTRWGPLGTSDVVLHKDVGCSDLCLAHDCQKAFKCLDAISTEEVFSAIKRMGVLRTFPKI